MKKLIATVALIAALSAVTFADDPCTIPGQTGTSPGCGVVSTSIESDTTTDVLILILTTFLK